MRVLIVDDDKGLRSLLRLVFEEAGYQVAEAGDGHEAIRLLRHQDADLILCDVFMQGMGGLDFLRQLNPTISGSKVVVMSGGGEFHGTVNLLPVASFLGAVAVLHKPFLPAE